MIWDRDRAAIAASKFHAHLDECQQCEAHPFDLCSIGRKLLSDLVQDDGVVEPLPPEDRR